MSDFNKFNQNKGSLHCFKCKEKVAQIDRLSNLKVWTALCVACLAEITKRKGVME